MGFADKQTQQCLGHAMLPLCTYGAVGSALRVAAPHAHRMASAVQARPVCLRATTFSIVDDIRAFIGCLPRAAGRDEEINRAWQAARIIKHNCLPMRMVLFAKRVTDREKKRAA